MKTTSTSKIILSKIFWCDIGKPTKLEIHFMVCLTFISVFVYIYRSIQSRMSEQRKFPSFKIHLPFYRSCLCYVEFGIVLTWIQQSVKSFLWWNSKKLLQNPIFGSYQAKLKLFKGAIIYDLGFALRSWLSENGNWCEIYRFFKSLLVFLTLKTLIK